MDSDEQITRDYHARIRRTNRKGGRYPCPTCKRPDAIGEWEKRQGYHCADCTALAEL